MMLGRIFWNNTTGIKGGNRLKSSQKHGTKTLIGKVVDFEFLSGATKGRMGRIFRLREDIVPGNTLGL